MKRVIFENIYIQNFLSVGLPGISISFQEGLNLITGINLDKDSRNGVGKSTVIESLYWCLYGETMREIKKDQVVNNINKKDCLVSLTFKVIGNEGSKQYYIVREAKPSKVTIHEDNVDITKSTISKVDDYIAKLINANGVVFQNAVIMTANNTTPFMAQKKSDKRKFIEDMLRLSVFGDMSLLVRNDFSETRKLYEFNFDKNQTLLKNIKMYEEQQEKQKNNKAQRIEEINKRIEANDQEITESKNTLIDLDESQLASLQDMVKTYPNLITAEKNNLKIQTKASHELEFKIKQKQAEIEKIDPSITVCYACEQNLPETHTHKTLTLKKEIAEEIKSLQNKHEKIYGLIYTTNNNITLLENDLSKNKEAIHRIELQKKDNDNKFKKIRQLEVWNDQLRADISSIESETNNFTDILSETIAENTSVEDSLSKYQRKLQIIDAAKLVVSEEGVKSFIVKKMLQLLNSKLNFYLTKLEAPCRCMFNEFFEEIIFNDKNQECSYFNFSNGERKRIDLAMLFMFQDIRRLQSDVSINLSMYDELFDSALDERGCECILSLLKERVETNNEAIYIVSHNKNTVKAGINSIVYLQKYNGITTLACE